MAVMGKIVVPTEKGDQRVYNDGWIDTAVVKTYGDQNITGEKHFSTNIPRVPEWGPSYLNQVANKYYVDKNRGDAWEVKEDPTYG
jgi:hypothetical protein